MATKAKIGVLGASGYTGSELVRLLLRHPRVEIALLTADRRAGQEMRNVFPQFAPFALPTLVSIDSVDWKTAGLDLIFCALPHATTQKVIAALLAAAPATKVVDVASGSMAGLTDTGIVIDEGYAKDHKLVVGDKVDALLANTPATLTVAGIFKSAAGLPSETLVTLGEWSATGNPAKDAQVYVNRAAGADAAAVSGAIDKLTADLPTVSESGELSHVERDAALGPGCPHDALVNVPAPPFE